MRKITLGVLSLAFLSVLAINGRLNAKTLYYDDFDGLPGAELNTTVPDITVDGAAWEAGRSVTANGTLGSLFTAVLPFVPNAGTVYELSATFDNEGDWAAIGFLTTPSNLDARILDNEVLLWSLVRETGSADFDQAFVGPGTEGALGDATVSSATELKVRLETIDETKWLVSWFFDGVQEFQQTVDPATFEMNYVAFGTNGVFNVASGTINNFKLVEVTELPVQASEPVPAEEATDVRRDVIVSWLPGESAATHDIYFGTVLDHVNEATRTNPMGVLVSQGQTGTTYDPDGLLEVGQTYYWRVDEVNAAPDRTLFKGRVWSFTAEPVVYPVAGIIATSNATSNPGVGPENTVNGSGLSEDGAHSIAAEDMWIGVAAEEEPTYIQYEFDRVYKLYEMEVWNYNVIFELLLGFGIKDATVEYSVDGVEWMLLGDVVLSQGTAKANYAANTTVDFAGVPAKYVRLGIRSGYGTTGQFGLSEVRFLYIPAHAREPQPVDGATEVAVDAVLSWRAGREATAHEVYLSTGAGAVVDGTALVGSVGENRYASGGLDFGQSYYWRVDEVNGAEAISVWEGDIWSFASQEYAVVDGFEGFNDLDNRIDDTWVDGWGNDTGSTVGYQEAPFAERVIVHGGRQSMPLEYNNADAPFHSEASRTWATPQDWTAGGADSVRLYVQGDPNNVAETLYVALEDSAEQVAVVSHPNAETVLSDRWIEWQISLGEFSGVNLAGIETMRIGVGDRNTPTAGGTGLIFIDDIGFGHPAAVVE